MSRHSERWLGSLVLVTGVLWLIASFLGRTWSPSQPARQMLVLYAGTAGAILYAVARFWFWRLEVGRPGASLLLGSALLGLAGGLMLFSWLGRQFGAEPIVFIYVDAAVALAALALLSAGLLRARLVSVGVASIGLAAAALHLVRLLMHGLAGPIPSLVASGTEVAFLFAVAGLLVMRHPRPCLPEVPEASAL